MTTPSKATAPRYAHCFSISHDKDVDGLASAAIVWRYAKRKGLKHQVALTDYGSFEFAFKRVAELKNALIIVTDLGLDDNSRGTVIAILKKAVQNGCCLLYTSPSPRD